MTSIQMRRVAGSAALILLLLAVDAVAVPGDLDNSFSDDGKKTTEFGGDDLAEDVIVLPSGKIVAARLWTGGTGG